MILEGPNDAMGSQRYGSTRDIGGVGGWGVAILIVELTYELHSTKYKKSKLFEAIKKEHRGERGVILIL